MLVFAIPSYRNELHSMNTTTIHYSPTRHTHTYIYMVFQRMNKNWLGRSLAHSFAHWLNQFIHSNCSASSAIWISSSFESTAFWYNRKGKYLFNVLQCWFAGHYLYDKLRVLSRENHNYNSRQFGINYEQRLSNRNKKLKGVENMLFLLLYQLSCK